MYKEAILMYDKIIVMYLCNTKFDQKFSEAYKNKGIKTFML